MARQDSIIQMAGVAILIVAAVGVQRSGFNAALNATNNTTLANRTEAFQQMTGLLVEQLPLLALALAAVFVLSVLR
jgi:peroxiredoxin